MSKRNKVLLIIIFAIVALVIAVSWILHQKKVEEERLAEEQRIREGEALVNSINEIIQNREYESAVELLNENDLDTLQEFSENDLKLIQSSLPVAIELEKVYQQNKEEYIIEFAKVKEQLSPPLDTQAKERFSMIIDEYLSVRDYEKIGELKKSGYINDQYLPPATLGLTKEAVKFNKLTDLYKNNELEELMQQTVVYKEGTVYNYLYYLVAAITYEPNDPGMVAANLVTIPEDYNEFPKFFQEKYDKLMEKYRNSEHYEGQLSVQHAHEVTEKLSNFTKYIQIGMTASEVQSIVGYPTDINKTVTAYGTSEQWVYDIYTGLKFVYLEDGIVTSVSD